MARVERALRAPTRPAVGEQPLGDLRVDEREPAPRVDQLDECREPFVVGRRSPPAERGDERVVLGGERIEVPRTVQQIVHRGEAAGLGVEHGAGADQVEVAQHRVGDRLAIGVRADRDRRRQEPEAGERQPAAQVMAFGALVLRHRAQHDEPVVVPLVAVGAEPVDPFRPDRQQLTSVRRQAPPRPAADALALDEALIRGPGDRLAGVALGDTERGEPVDERLRPGTAAAGQDELAEDRQQQRLGAGPRARARVALRSRRALYYDHRCSTSH